MKILRFVWFKHRKAEGTFSTWDNVKHQFKGIFDVVESEYGDLVGMKLLDS